MADEVIKDKDIKVGDKTIGFSSIVKLNVKTLLWVMGILYIVLGYLYFDLKKGVSDSSSVLQTEKQEFLHGVETTLYRDITDIKVGMEGMRGEINIILDRSNRVNPVTANPNVAIQPTVPPPVTTDQ